MELNSYSATEQHNEIKSNNLLDNEISVCYYIKYDKPYKKISEVKLAIKKSATEEMYEKKFISGESFSYLGRTYRLQIVEDNEDLKLKYGWFILGKKKQVKAKEIFKNWYSSHLKIKIDERLELICKNAKIDTPNFKIMEYFI
jgi:predicted metal-dependent hydrolase